MEFFCLARKVNKSYRGRSCPMIMHCSDGVGRSGTYVLIDMVLNRMTKGSKEIDIAATLEHIRDQRAGERLRLAVKHDKINILILLLIISSYFLRQEWFKQDLSLSSASWPWRKRPTQS